MQANAERRQLTVMFCDLVGSTPLSARLDPEDLRGIMGAYHRCVAEIVAGFGGFVARYMGDGVLVYFGYPQAHEDDAERATRCGLALVDRTPQLNQAEKLYARVGIATGLVVVGGEVVEHDVAGDTPNLAARLQALAEPDTVVIAASTRRLTGALFEYRDLGEIELKGIEAPVPAWQVLRPSAVASRFEALRGAALSPLIGRDEEIDLLLRRWVRAKMGDGQIVLVAGEAGIGKSRLAAALAERLYAVPHIHLRYFCSPHHRDSAFYPFIDQLGRAAGFALDDAPSAKIDKLVALLARAAPPPQDLTLIADLLSLPSSEHHPLPNLSPQRKKEKVLEALIHQLDGLGRQQPVLLVFEDAQWIDPTSRELLDLMVERIRNLPVLLMITHRPEFQPPWTGEPQVNVLALNRLGLRDRTVLIEEIAGGKALPNQIVKQIVERTDGVPLFVEEMTKSVLGSDLLREADCYVLEGTLPPLAIPASLHDSLMARLDRLGPSAKEVAQIGAAIGREFSFELLAATASREEVALEVTQLVEAGLVFQRGLPPEASFLFKHALVQDAAYGTLLRGPRQLLHARIADILLSTGEMRSTAPEILAHHLQNAGRSVEAVSSWRAAGEQAVRRAANREAIEHFHRALSLLDARPETAERWRAELAILSQLAPALMNVHGRSAPQVGAVVDRAADVGRRLESSADLAPSIANLWLFNMARGRLDRAEEISVDLFRIARELDDREILLQAHHAAWPTRFHRGRLTEASEHISAGLALYDEERHAHHRYVYLGHDPATCALANDSFVQQMLGYPVRAMHREDEAVTLARRLRHAPSLVHVQWLVCDSQAARGDDAAVIATAKALLKLSDEHGLPRFQALAGISLGWALARSGETEEGITRLVQGLGTLSKMGVRAHLTRSLYLMADTHLLSRRYPEGLEQVGRALNIAEETDEQWLVSRLLQMRAELLLHIHGPGDEAVEASLWQALAVAGQQSAKGWELPAATRLARLWLDRGRRDDARSLLSPVYGWFTEGFDTPDLKEAKALLDELA